MMMPEPFDNHPLLLDLLWQTTLGLAAALIARRFSAHRPARAHALLLLGAAAALLTPALSAMFRTLDWGLIAPLVLDSRTDVQRPPPLIGATPLAGATLTWLGAIVLAWSITSLVLLIRLARSHQRGRRMMRRAIECADVRLESIIRDAALRIGVRSRIDIHILSEARCPMIWCWSRRPRLLLPAALIERLAADRLHPIVCHELAHLRRRDHIASLIGELAVCLLPWQPLVWLVRRGLRDESERACDAWAIASGTAPTRYAETLLGLLPAPHQPFALAAVNGKRGVARRITDILHRSTGSPRLGARWFLVATIAVVMLVSGAALAHRRDPLVIPTHVPTVARTILLPPPAVIDDPNARLAVRAAPAEVDLGDIAPGAVADGSVWLINTDREAHFVRDAKASCGCTVIHNFTPRSLAPGEWMKLDLSMTAPETFGTAKLKYLTFRVDGQPPLRVPVRLRTTDRVD
jgi:beta-lactamase regulating signal transducer with metallopeptidase domain